MYSCHATRVHSRFHESYSLANILRGERVSEKSPILPDDAFRYRGVGPKTLPYL